MAKHSYGFYIAMLAFVVVVIYFVYYTSRKSKGSKEQYQRTVGTPIGEYVNHELRETPSGELIEEIVDDFRLIDIPPNEENPAFAVGFGMGEGIYGTGRNIAVDSITLNSYINPL